MTTTVKGRKENGVWAAYAAKELIKSRDALNKIIGQVAYLNNPIWEQESELWNENALWAEMDKARAMVEIFNIFCADEYNPPLTVEYDEEAEQFSIKHKAE